MADPRPASEAIDMTRDPRFAIYFEFINNEMEDISDAFTNLQQLSEGMPSIHTAEGFQQLNNQMSWEIAEIYDHSTLINCWLEYLKPSNIANRQQNSAMRVALRELKNDYRLRGERVLVIEKMLIGSNEDDIESLGEPYFEAEKERVLSEILSNLAELRPYFLNFDFYDVDFRHDS